MSMEEDNFEIDKIEILKGNLREEWPDRANRINSTEKESEKIEKVSNKLPLKGKEPLKNNIKTPTRTINNLAKSTNGKPPAKTISPVLSPYNPLESRKKPPTPTLAKSIGPSGSTTSLTRNRSATPNPVPAPRTSITKSKTTLSKPTDQKKLADQRPLSASQTSLAKYTPPPTPPPGTKSKFTVHRSNVYTLQSRNKPENSPTVTNENNNEQKLASENSGKFLEELKNIKEEFEKLKSNSELMKNELDQVKQDLDEQKNLNKSLKTKIEEIENLLPKPKDAEEVPLKVEEIVETKTEEENNEVNKIFEISN